MMIILSMVLVHPLYAQTLENTNLSNDSGRSTDPRISVSGSNVYVVWSDTTTGNGDIYFKASTANGTTFSSWKNLSNNTGVSSSAKIATSGKSNVYVVWSDTTTGNGDIYLKASTDSGFNFTGKKTLSSKGDVGSSISPQIATSGKSNVYVVWSDTTTGNGDIYFKSSTDNGTTFSKTKNLINTNGSSTDPQIATSGKSNVYVVWSDTTTGNGDIYLRTITYNGTTFSKTKKLSNDTGSSTDPQIATSGKSNVYVVW